MQSHMQTIDSSEKTSITSSEQIMQVSGSYQIYEYQIVDTERKLVLLPLIAKITQLPHHVSIDLYDETDESTTTLNYPMNEASYWNEEHRCFIFSRAVGETLVADYIIPPTSNDRKAMATHRITWIADGNGRIKEISDDYDMDGNRLESSRGHYRTLVPIAQA